MQRDRCVCKGSYKITKSAHKQHRRARGKVFSMVMIHKNNGMQYHQIQQPLRRCAPAPLVGEPNIGATSSREAAPKPPLLGEQRTAALAACESPSPCGWKRHGGVEYQKPPLLGEVARRSRDGGVASLGKDGALAFSMVLIHKSNGMQHHQSQQPLRRCAPAPLAGEPFGWTYSLEQEVEFL